MTFRISSRNPEGSIALVVAPPGSPPIDAAAFNALYAVQLKPVFNYVRFRLGDGDAEDVTAGVFERAWAHRTDVDAARGSAEAWLWAIARNAVTDHLRWRAKAPVPLSGNLPASADPRDVALVRCEWTRTVAAIRRLPDVDQDIIALRFGGGRSHREIAALLGLGEANVAQRLRRALARLRSRLAKDEVGSR